MEPAAGARHREVLRTLRDFLDRVGEHWWAEWVQIAMEDGRYPGPAGGPGSHALDSLVIGVDRIDHVPPHLLPWANVVLDCLRCLLHRIEVSSRAGESHEPASPVPLQAGIAVGCGECFCDTCRRSPPDEVRSRIRRSVERAVHEGRYDSLMVLGRLDPGDSLP